MSAGDRRARRGQLDARLAAEGDRRAAALALEGADPAPLIGVGTGCRIGRVAAPAGGAGARAPRGDERQRHLAEPRRARDRRYAGRRVLGEVDVGREHEGAGAGCAGASPLASGRADAREAPAITSRHDGTSMRRERLTAPTLPKRPAQRPLGARFAHGTPVARGAEPDSKCPQPARARPVSGGAESTSRAWQDSNLRPSAPEADALSPELQARAIGEIGGPAYRGDRDHLGHPPAQGGATAARQLRRAVAGGRADRPRGRPLDDGGARGDPLLRSSRGGGARQRRRRGGAGGAARDGGFTAAGARIAVVHDAGPRQGRLGRLKRRFPDADAVIFGHSHLPLHETDPATGFQIVNPGSPTERRRAPHHTMAMAATTGRGITVTLVTLD